MINIRYLRLLPAATITLGVVVVIALLFWLKQMLDAPLAPPKPKVQQITLITPPPPPPPPPKQEEPPPEPERIETPEPEPQPEAPQDQPADEAPPGEDLGLDAEGGAGSDGFGLVGRKGGRGLIGGGGDAKGWYMRRLDQDLTEFFNGHKELRKGKRYSVELSLWMDATGRVERYQVGAVSGGATREMILTAMAGLDRVPPPPEGTQQPVRFRLSSRG